MTIVTTTTPADLLDAAADHIETYGWTQEEFAADPTRPLECAVCARGGISVAAGQHPMFTEEPVEFATHPLVTQRPHELMFCEEWEELGPEDQASLDLIRAAERALAARVAPRRTVSAHDFVDAVAEWNDVDGRTAEQVIADLRATAAELRKGQVPCE